jgi:hypothetical protein
LQVGEEEQRSPEEESKALEEEVNPNVRGGLDYTPRPQQPPSNACPIDWRLGDFKSPQRWANQMLNRGWTEQQITDAIKNGASFPARNNVNPLNPAIRFENRETGQSVVIDTTTGEVLHVGGKGFKY